VTLYALPLASVEQTLAVGDVVPRAVVGSATTDASGSYAISITNWSAVLSDADSNNIVNLELDAFSPAAQSEWAGFDFPRQVVTLSDGSLALAVADPDGNGGVDLTAQQANLNMTYVPRSPRPSCGIETLVADLGGKNSIVGAGYSKLAASPKISFTYGSGQESSLGVAIANSDGTWSAKGTVDRSSTDTQGWTTQNDSTFFKTEFRFGDFHEPCAPNRVRARFWMAGASHTSGSNGEFTVTNPADNCVHEDAGAPFTKKHESQYNYGGGVGIQTDIGIDLSVQTGWSTSDSLKMVAPSTTAVRLCGLSGPPANGPKKLQFIPLP